MNDELKFVFVVSCVVAVLLTLGILGARAADEITIDLFFQLDNDDLDFQETITGYTVDQRFAGLASGVQSIQTGAWEQIVIPVDVSSNGYAFFRTTTTNSWRYVDIGTHRVGSGYTNSTAFVRLWGSEMSLVRLHPTNAIYARSGTSSNEAVTGVNLKWAILED